MTLDSEPLSSELPYPPVVSQRRAVPPPLTDDAVLLRPFSRALAGQAATAPAPWTPEPPTTAAVRPAPPELRPFAVAAEAAPLPVAAEFAPRAATAEPPLPAVAGRDQELANEVAGRLERMALQLRRQGFHALLEARPEREPIDVVLASVIAGFVARR